jgi:Raf kinase inhibitor-like YbhB/YbcL family protein
MGFAPSLMNLSSNTFVPSGAIPKRATMEGENLSPHLKWTSVPEGTKSFALFCHDPDAPLAMPGCYGFVHWVLYNLPASIIELAEGAAATQGTQGLNDFGEAGYGGPMPPPGHGTHHYFFVLMALDKALDLKPNLTLWQLMSSVESHVIGMNRLMGTYQR